MVIVTAADDRFALPLGVMVHSLLTNAQPDTEIVLYILSDGISPKHKQRLESVVSQAKNRTVDLRWVDARAPFSTATGKEPTPLKTTPFLSETTYLRLLIPDLISNAYDRAIYLDADVIVERDLTPLWTEPFAEADLLAVRDFNIQTVDHPKGLHLYRELGLSPKHPYFNSGVLVMNLRSWREKSISENVFTYLRENDNVVNMVDQDGLNATLANTWRALDARWNRQSAISDLDRWPESTFKQDLEARRDAILHAPFIDHFTGNDKPWNILTDHPSKDRFLDYLGSSGWFSPLEFRAWRGFRAARIPEQYLRTLTRPLRHRASRLLRID